uniref:Uncharacterized protein n=1 Tax=Arundo donax TaxID=35708 RepID=A0A0A9TJU1_ARUDO
MVCSYMSLICFLLYTVIGNRIALLFPNFLDKSKIVLFSIFQLVSCSKHEN